MASGHQKISSEVHMTWMLNEAWVEELGNNPIVARKIEGRNAKEDAVNPLILPLSTISKVHQGVVGLTN